MKKLLLFALLFGAATAAQAETCEINKATDILTCAIEKHPSVQQANAQIPIAGINKEIAGAWPNPELEMGIGYSGEDEQYRGTQAEIAIMQTIETPARRKARTTKASAGYSYALATAEGQKEMVAVQMLTGLNRLRQINKEKRIFDEITATFGGIIKKYNARPVLSPEDKVSLDIFKSTLETAKLEKNQLAVEEKNLVGNMRLVLGSDWNPNEKMFLYAPLVWPAIKRDGIGNSVALARESVNIELARAEYYDAKSSAFGGIRVGPYIQTRPGDMGKIDAYGVKVAIPLPIFTSGWSASKAGKMSVAAAEQGYRFKEQELQNAFDNLASQYEMGVAALSQYKIDGIEKQHKNTEKMFSSGRVSSSIFIEAHRQLLESVRTYHAYEMESLSALWEIYAMQRKLLTNLGEVCYEK
jgi:cobalt-zinc-cadmium efflux system outer membrane protein